MTPMRLSDPPEELDARLPIEPGDSELDDNAELGNAEPGTIEDSRPSVVSRAMRTDTLASSLAILLVMSVLQRLVGFGRQVLVCRWLEKEELGQWDLAFRFLMLAAPLAAFGIPGSFGRYLEHFRQRGHLKTFLRRTATACALLGCVAILLMTGLQSWVAEQIYSDRTRTGMVNMLVVSLFAVIAFNFLTDMFTALRMVRVTAQVQFWSTLLFAALSIGLLMLWRQDAVAIVAAYAISCAVTFAAAIVWFRKAWRSMPDAQDHLPHSQLWLKLGPFAAWLCSVNLLYNLTGVVDRYMLMHYAPVDSELARYALVGDYHTSQVVPMLMVSVCGILGGIIMPYLSHDWETGNKRDVSIKLNLTVKLLGLGMVFGSALTLLAAPILFDILLHGKYTGGFEILPWTLTYCVWMGLIPLAQMYLWCAERPTLVSVSLAVGLIVNVVLCRILLPSHSLHAVAWASAAANLVSLTLIYRFNYSHGMRIDRGVWLVTLLPFAIGGGTIASVVAVVVAGLAVVLTNQILSREEKQLLMTTWRRHSNSWKRKPDIAAAEIVVASTDTHTEL